MKVNLRVLILQSCVCLFILLYQMCGFFVSQLFVGLCCTCLEQMLCLCSHVCVCFWQLLWACVSLVVFRSIKQFRHLHGLLLRAEDPKKCLTVVQKPRAILTNICSHCELLACDTTLYRKEAFTGRHTHPREHIDSRQHAGTNLSFF